MSFNPLGSIGQGSILIGANTGGLRGQVRQGMRAIKQEMDRGAADIQASGQRASKGFSALAGVAKASMFAIAGVVGIGVGAAMQFESAWAGVRKTVDATPERLAKLRGEFRQLAKEIPVSVNELAHIGETAGALGIATDNILDFTKTVALLGQTTDVSTEQASTALGQLSNVLNMTGADYEKFASTLVDLGNKGASTESQILEITSRAGAGAALIGFSTKQTLAWASSIASLGIEVEAGGSSLQNFFLKSQKLVNDPAGLKTLASVAGMTGKEFKKAFEEDASGALMTFIAGLGQLNASDQLAVLDALKMNDIRITRGLLGLANKPELLAQNLDVATAAWEANVAVTEEAEKRFETTASALGLLKNVLQDMFIEAGDQALPLVKALVILFRDELPKAIDFLAGVWQRILLPPLEILGEAFGKLGTAVGKLFGGGEASDWASTTGTAVEGLASAVGQLAKMLAAAIEGVAWLLENPIVQWAARALIAWKLLGVAIRTTGSAIGGLNSASGGLLRKFGLGGLVGGAAAAGANAPMALNESANNLNRSAANLDRAAGALSRGGGAAAAGAGARGWGGSPYDIRYAQDPAFSRRTGGGSLYGALGQPLAYGIADKEKWAANPNFGRNLAQRFMGGAAGALTKGLASIKNVALAGLGLASKAFWPLVIASLATEFVKAPLGDLVASSTQFKRAGALIKEDFFGGLAGLVSSWAKGTDLSLAIERLPIGGGRSFGTSFLRNVNLSDSQIESLMQEGVAGAQAQRDIIPKTLKEGLQRRADESVADWARRVRESLADAGLNTALLDNAMKALPPPEDLGPFNFLHEIDPTWLQSTVDAEALASAGLTEAIQKSLDIGISGVQTELQKGLRESVVSAVRSWSGGRVKLSDLLNLPGATYEKLAELMVLDAQGLIDPRVLSLTLSGILDKPTVAPIGTSGGHPSQRLTTQAQALNFERSDIAADKKSFNDWVASLTPDQAAARQAAINVLDSLNKGIREAGKDEAKQKAFLKDINEALGLSGEAAISWEELIDWRAQLGEETGETARKQLERRTRKLAVMAARSGASGGAAEFIKVWGADIEKADTTKEKEALRKKLNKLIPGTADDFSKKEFASWLKDIQKKGADEAKEALDESNRKIWSGGLKNPDIKDSVTRSVARDVVAVISGAAKEAAENPKLVERLNRYGVKITKGIASGINSPEGKRSITQAISDVVANLKPQLPSSPVAAGPLKHPYLLNAGRNIVDQIGQGMKKASLSLPKLDMAGATGPGGSGRSVTIYADKLQTFSPADERSITQRFEFLAQDGR